MKSHYLVNCVSFSLILFKLEKLELCISPRSCKYVLISDGFLFIASALQGQLAKVAVVGTEQSWSQRLVGNLKG